MRPKTYTLFLAILVALAVAPATRAAADGGLDTERQLKAAFIYNFIKFVEWPDEKTVDEDTPITIGIIGSQGFIEAFEPFKEKKLKNRRVQIKYLSGYEQFEDSSPFNLKQQQQRIETLRACDVVLLCECNVAKIKSFSTIIDVLDNAPVLTVGEREGFLEDGGMINFLTVGKKVRFEINNDAAKRAKLRISSHLLRLAKRVVSEKSLD